MSTGELIVTKGNERYSKVSWWVTRNTFSLMNFIGSCLHGTRLVYNRRDIEESIRNSTYCRNYWILLEHYQLIFERHSHQFLQHFLYILIYKFSCYWFFWLEVTSVKKNTELLKFQETLCFFFLHVAQHQPESINIILFVDFME